MTNQIRKYRLKRGIKQSTLAHEAGVTQATISNAERDKYVPRVDLAIKLARALDVSVETLFIVDE